MQSDNFLPLKSSWPQLYEFGAFAELYAYSDPHTSIVKLRCFVELVVGILYRELNIPSPAGDGLFEKLKADVFLQAIDSAIVQKIHVIRVLGNKAAHARQIRSADALSLIKEAYLISKWLCLTYSGASNAPYPPFIAPTESLPSQSDTNDTEQARQLSEARNELSTLEGAESAAQAHIVRLQDSLDEARVRAFMDSAVRAAATIDLETEATRRLIDIHDVFAEYSLTDGQSQLVSRLEQFLSSRSESVFLMRGYAGTGKTFLTKGLTEYLRAIGRNFVLAAPTGKAAKVIATKTRSGAHTIHKSIYSFKDIVEYRDESADGTETYKFYFNLAVNEHSVDTVYIIDEASMVADVYQEGEFFRFGSGYLLRDFLSFINLDHNDHTKKVIFIGDEAQLPPVGMANSPALSPDYLMKQYHLRSTSFDLTEVVRQKAGSGIIANTLQLRQGLKKGVFNSLVIDDSYPDVESLGYEDLLPRYLTACAGNISGAAIVIAHSNADVAEFNRLIRGHFFPECPEIVPGDKVMAVINTNIGASGIFISNGDVGVVRQVLGESEERTVTLRKKGPSGTVRETTVPISFRDIMLEFRDPQGVARVFKAKVIETLLYGLEAGLSSDQSKALYVDFCIRNQHLPRRSVEFKQQLRDDIYFNAMRLKFGYAITCHKAQGSEWNHVFVKCLSHHKHRSAEYFRWFYTAMTRAAQKLYLMNPPQLKIGDGIGYVAGTTVPPVEARPHDYVVSDVDGQRFGITDSELFRLGLLGKVSALISTTDVGIEDIVRNLYRESYVFRRAEEHARVDINYNGRGKIVGVQAQTASELSTEIELLLGRLKGSIVSASVATATEELAFEHEFLKEFHESLVTLAGGRGIAIRDLQSRTWCQRYTFSKSDQAVVYDLFYNGKGCFTRCAPVAAACSPGTLMSEVGALLTEGFSG